MMSSRKPFSLLKRNSVYYVRFRLPDGLRSVPKSTGQTSRGRAEAWAIDYLRAGQGQIVVKENITFQDFSKDFFDWNGTWATDKRVRGLRISPRHCLERNDLLHNHLIPAFGKQKLTAIDRALIKDFRNTMFKNGFSGSTINKCLSTIKTILDAAEERSLIQYVPRIDRAADNPKRKGILTLEEAVRLFSFQWMTRPAFRHPAKSDFMGQVGNLLAITTGLRLSEIQALTFADIHLDKNYLTVRRSWDNRRFCHNETTKSGKERTIFFSDLVKSQVMRLIEMNPFGNDPDNFLFFGDQKDRAKDHRFFMQSLYYALEQIGIDATERLRRNITFHGHRHFLNSLLIGAKVPLQTVQSITGHLTAEMTQHYYHIGADDMRGVLQITDAITTGIKKESIQ